MSNEVLLSRRENGLTIRFLAQCLVNDLVLPGQEGVRSLLSRSRVNLADGTGRSLIIDETIPFEYQFLFHMSDFESGDQSEIDLLLRQGETLFALEVKAFTNPNATNVKREIVRNHLTLERISRNQKHFEKTTRIVSILLYSEAVHQTENSSARTHNYFNDRYLLTKGPHQDSQMDVWDHASFEIADLRGHTAAEVSSIVGAVASNLYFLTWGDVLTTLEEVNTTGRFDRILSELRNKRDDFGRGCSLV